jgi:hypothetical protein
MGYLGHAMHRSVVRRRERAWPCAGISLDGTAVRFMLLLEALSARVRNTYAERTQSSTV